MSPEIEIRYAWMAGSQRGGKQQAWLVTTAILILPFFSTNRILILSQQSASFKNDHFPVPLAVQESYVTKLGQ